MNDEEMTIDVPEVLSFDETQRNYEFLLNRAERGYAYFQDHYEGAEYMNWEELSKEDVQCWLRIAHAILHEANEAPKDK